MDDDILGRVRELIAASRLKQVDFAERIGLEQDKFSKALNGRRKFSSFELAAIADVGGVTVDWILAGATAPTPAVAARAQLDDAIDADAIESVALRFTKAHDQLHLLAQRAELPLLPTLRTRVGYVRAAEELANWAHERLAEAGLKIVGAQQDELLTALEATFGLDAAVTELPWGLDGYAWQTTSLRLLIVGRTEFWSRQRFSIAHELGHLLAKDAQRLIAEQVERHSDELSEKRANAFAAAFLMPVKFLRDRTGATLGPEEFDALVSELLVSPKSLGWRLLNLGLIDERQRAAYSVATAEQCVIRSGGADIVASARERALAERLPPRLVRGHLDAYGRGETSARPLAELLAMSVPDVVKTYGTR